MKRCIIITLSIINIIFLVVTSKIKADPVQDLSVYLADRFRQDYLSYLKDHSPEPEIEINIIQSPYFKRYSVDKYKSMFTNYLTNDEIIKINKTHKYTKEQMEMIQEVKSKLVEEIVNIKVKYILEKNFR